MELRAYAEGVLLSPDLAAKLAPPGAFTDERPGAALVSWPEPARSKELALPRPGTRVRADVPGESELAASDEAKVRLLHSFANHELLALELMALVLLRFPDAPASFRGGLAATMVDEQRHLGLYIARIEALGGRFGGETLNRYFWDVCAEASSPLDFVTRMSLTLEQANLDFARHYRDLFARIGDQATSTILAAVYKDEIRHVRHGHTWFERWREPGPRSFDAFRAALPAPLTPARAKGIGFDAEGRRAAGLPEDFIAELKVYAHSKGRPPRLWSFNAGCEDEIAGAPPLSGKAAALVDDLRGVMVFLAAPDDVVLAPPPRPAFATALQAAGFATPQYEAEVKALQGRLLSGFSPWGYSPAVETWLAGAQLTFKDAPQAPRDYGVFAKTWAQEGALARDGHTSTIRALDDLVGLSGPHVLKAPLGASGRGLRRIDAPLTPADHKWAEQVLATQGRLVLEPWHDKLADLSVQIEVTPDVVRIKGLTRFFTDARGQYKGHKLGGMAFDGLTQEERRALDVMDALGLLNANAERIGNELRAGGYLGPAGIDAYVYRDGDGTVRLRPTVEVNPRYTMGRVALALDKRVSRATTGAWLILPVSRLDPAWAERYPLRRRGELLEHGVLFTTDPQTARAVASVMILGDAWRELGPTLSK